MANTFSRIYPQFVFEVQGRQSLIPKEIKEELHKYITGLVQNRKTKMLAVNCMPDHVHIFAGFKPTVLIPDFVKEIQVESNEFTKSKKWIKDKFNWQEGYWRIFLFTLSYRQSNKICFNQEAHHPKNVPA